MSQVDEDGQRNKQQGQFLSIKSINRNKKVFKKSLPSESFSHTTIGMENQCDYRKQKYKYSQKKASTSSCHSQANVVNLQFGRSQPFCEPKATQIKIRKKVGYSYREKSAMVATLSDTLMIGPLSQKGFNGCFSSLEKRKKIANQHMTVTKKTNRSFLQIDAVRTNCSNRDIEIMNGVNNNSLVKKQKLSRKTTTALHKRNSYNLFKKNTTGNEKQSVKFQTPPLLNRFIEVIERDSVLENDFLDQDKDREKEKEKEKENQILSQFKDFLPLRRPLVRKDYFIFGMSDKQVSQPENRIQIYRDFLWKINFSNSLYVHTPENLDINYKAYFGYGNNSCMLKSILRRRFWWTILEGPVQSTNFDNVQFLWTQLKINSIFKNQILKNQGFEFEKQNIEEKEHYQIIKNLDINTQKQQKIIMQQAHTKVFSYKDWKRFEVHVKKNAKTEVKINEQTYTKRLNLYAKKPICKISDSSKLKVHNHLEFNYFLGNKKALFYNMKRYCLCQGLDPFNYIPFTFHLSKGVDDPVYEQFLNYFNKLEEYKRKDKSFRNVWIVKPGENSNRGNGISICFGIDDIRHRLRGREKNSDGKARTFIVQKYLQKPFLYKNRKFDIRHFMLITCINGKIKGYWYQEGYIRTSSSLFNLVNTRDNLVHLTNDAIQKKAPTYGRHEKGNKISYEDFQKYLETNFKKRKLDFLGYTLERMKSLALMSLEATYSQLDPRKLQNNFELIGFDFMLDENFDPWLIEANTNPCLELSCSLLEKLIPNMIQQLFRICIDPLFPPPETFINKKQFFGENPILDNKFKIIFDDTVDGQRVQQIFRKQNEADLQALSCALNKIEEDDEEFDNDGDDKWEDKGV